MKNLLELTFEWGQIRELPDFFESFPNLETFDCSETPVAKFPQSFYELQNIKSIGIYRCRFRLFDIQKIKEHFPEVKLSYDPEVPWVPLSGNN